jgi:hypothetical protein|tara:strand:- start:113 stop:349 length:237 start_codon:yes stop_codon:yes gene_type:complete
MSTSIISTRVAELISFTKEKTISNLAESVSSGNINVSNDDLNKIMSLIDLSISQAFTAGYQNVDSAVNDLIKESRQHK